jgi:hypothetical protein
MPLRERQTNTWDHIQGFLFPMLREEVGPLTAPPERLAVVLGVARVEVFVQMWSGLPGRPPEDRQALALSVSRESCARLSHDLGIDREAGGRHVA